MQPKLQISDQGDLFRSRLDQMLDRQHELYRLADQIDWSFFEREFGPFESKQTPKLSPYDSNGVILFRKSFPN